jgi:hypothetical protein
MSAPRPTRNEPTKKRYLGAPLTNDCIRHKSCNPALGSTEAAGSCANLDEIPGCYLIEPVNSGSCQPTGAWHKRSAHWGAAGAPWGGA